ncbi:hypothetical protein F5B21DRAFT_340423 [Xylaria acuta]|nr:hypothetical protein F5B21DRAFT_340423 [Xylaria acuta]
MWRLRPLPWEPSGHMGPSGKWNLLLYIPNVTDYDYLTWANYELGSVPLQEICQDRDDGFYATQMKGNAPAAYLMQDYDNTISFGQQLVHNFEIAEPLGTSGDMDWVGEALSETFGKGWSGDQESLYGEGRVFAHRSKKEVLRRTLDLAKFGWQTRWRYMYRHVLGLRTVWDVPGPSFHNGPFRYAGINRHIHRGDILGDSILAEATGDFFADDPDVSRRSFHSLHQAAYSISYATTTEIRNVLDEKQKHPDILNLYDFLVKYIDRFQLWRDAVVGLLKNEFKPYNTPQSRRWTLKPHRAYVEAMRYFQRVNAEVQEFSKIRRRTWRDLYYSCEALNALVRLNKFNSVLTQWESVYANAYGSVFEFPNFLPEKSNSLPDIGPEVELVEPGGDLPPPGPGEPGGDGGLGGPGQPGGPGGLGGVGGLGGRSVFLKSYSFLFGDYK